MHFLSVRGGRGTHFLCEQALWLDFLNLGNLVLTEERLLILRGVFFIIVRMLCAFGVASGGVEGRREGRCALCLLFLIFKCYS